MCVYIDVFILFAKKMTNLSGINYKDFVLVSSIFLAVIVTFRLNNYNLWHVIPKTRISGAPSLGFQVSMNALNVGLVVLLFILIWTYLDLRQRCLDDLLQTVYEVTKETNLSLRNVELEKTTTLERCVQMLDINSEHYDQVLLLHQEYWSKDLDRSAAFKQKLLDHKPPRIEESETRLNAFDFS